MRARNGTDKRENATLLIFGWLDNVLLGDNLRGHHANGKTDFHQFVDLHVHAVNGVGDGEDDGAGHGQRRCGHVHHVAGLAVETGHMFRDEP